MSGRAGRGVVPTMRSQRGLAAGVVLVPTTSSSHVAETRRGGEGRGGGGRGGGGRGGGRGGRGHGRPRQENRPRTKVTTTTLSTISRRTTQGLVLLGAASSARAQRGDMVICEYQGNVLAIWSGSFDGVRDPGIGFTQNDGPARFRGFPGGRGHNVGVFSGLSYYFGTTERGQLGTTTDFGTWDVSDGILTGDAPFAFGDGGMVLPAGYQPNQQIEGSYCVPGATLASLGINDGAGEYRSWDIGGVTQRVEIVVRQNSCAAGASPAMCAPTEIADCLPSTETCSLSSKSRRSRKLNGRNGRGKSSSTSPQETGFPVCVYTPGDSSSKSSKSKSTDDGRELRKNRKKKNDPFVETRCVDEDEELQDGEVLASCGCCTVEIAGEPQCIESAPLLEDS